MKSIVVRRPYKVSRSVRASVESMEARRLLATHIITTLADSGAGSLREALQSPSLASNDTIDLRNLNGTIQLDNQLTLAFTRTGVKVLGPGRDKLTIDASNTVRAFNVANQQSGIIISDLTIRGSSLAQ